MGHGFASVEIWKGAPRCAQAAGLAAALTGLLVLSGWALDIAALKQVLPGHARMAFNTALAVAFCGFALTRLAAARAAAPARLPGSAAMAALLGVVLAIGLGTLAEYLFAVDLGIDQALFRVQGGGSGRPAFASALLLSSTALALGLACGGPKRAAAAQALAFAGGTFALVLLLGYVFGVSALYSVPAFGVIALHTVVVLLVLQLGILCVRAEMAPMRVFFVLSPSGMLARRLVLAVVFLVPVLAGLRLMGQHAGWYGTEFGVAILSGTLIALLVLLIGVGAHTAQQAEALRLRATRLYMALSGTNQAIVLEEERGALLARVCRAAVEKAGFSIAWVGLTEGGIDQLQPAASAGAPPGFIDYAMSFIRGDDATRRRVVATVEGGETIVFNDLVTLQPSPRRGALLAAGLRSFATLPIFIEGRVRGMLYVYSKERDYFRAEEMVLLQEMAGDVGFGLSRLLAQERHRAAEAEVRRLNQELEERVSRRTAALRQANEDLASFNYSASHDLRAPLRHIRGFIHMAMEEAGGALPPACAQMLSRAEAGAERLDTLIEDMLSLSRTRDAPFNPMQVDLSALAAEICADLRAQAGAAVRFDIAPGLATQGDAALLRIMLTNLLGNACKYSSRRAAPRVAFGCETGADGAPVYFVRDNGAGFDMKHADKLFQPFRRLHGAQDFPGTGIGLAIVRRVVERHGGRVWAQAAPQAGATFFFTLPGAPAAAPEVLPAAA